MTKTKWSTKAIRNMMQKERRPKDGQPCYVCHKNDFITELHHVIPVSKLAELINEYGLPFDKVKTPVVWLCPNCHSYLHKSKNNIHKVVIEMTMAGYTRESITRLAEISRIAEESLLDICENIDEDAE